MFEDFDSGLTINRLFGYYLSINGFVCKPTGVGSLADSDGYRQAVQLVIEFFIFLVFEFKPTAKIGGGACSPEVWVLERQVKVDLSSLETITKACMRELENFLSFLQRICEAKKKHKVSDEWMFLRPRSVTKMINHMLRDLQEGALVSKDIISLRCQW